MEIFRNEFVSVVTTPKGFAYYDLNDKQNETIGYTRLKRGLKKAEQQLKWLNNDETAKHSVRMKTITEILNAYNLKPRLFCGVD